MTTEKINRHYFVFFESYLEAVEDLEANEGGQVLIAMARYALYGEEPKLKGYLLSIFKASKPNLDNSIRKYINGCGGGRPSKTKAEPNENQTETKRKPKHNQNTTKTEPNENRTETKTKANESLYNHEEGIGIGIEVGEEVEVEVEDIATTQQHNTTDFNFCVKNFLAQCACADTREEAAAMAADIQQCFHVYYDCGRVIDEFKQLSLGEQLLFSLYVRHADIQQRFETPIIEWQATRLTQTYTPEQINRSIEQVENKLDEVTARNRQAYVAVKKFIENDFKFLKK